MLETTFRIIYCSRSTVECDVDSDEFRDILATSRRNNAAAGVTGALLYNDGVFAQTLEGSFEAVQAVFERIQCDTRHDDIVILQADNVDDRLFSSWAMAQAESADPAAARKTLAGAMVDTGAEAAPALLDMLSCVVRHEPA